MYGGRRQVGECFQNVLHEFCHIFVFICASFLKLQRVSANISVLGRCSAFPPVGHCSNGLDYCGCHKAFYKDNKRSVLVVLFSFTVFLEVEITDSSLPSFISSLSGRLSGPRSSRQRSR